MTIHFARTRSNQEHLETEEMGAHIFAELLKVFPDRNVRPKHEDMHIEIVRIIEETDKIPQGAAVIVVKEYEFVIDLRDCVFHT